MDEFGPWHVSSRDSHDSPLNRSKSTSLNLKKLPFRPKKQPISTSKLIPLDPVLPTLRPLLPVYRTSSPRPVVALKLTESSQPMKKVPSMMTRNETPTHSHEALMLQQPVFIRSMSQMRRNRPCLNPLSELNCIISKSMQRISVTSKREARQSALRFRVIRSRQANLKVVGVKHMT
jgi:hypothetical protein